MFSDSRNSREAPLHRISATEIRVDIVSVRSGNDNVDSELKFCLQFTELRVLTALYKDKRVRRAGLRQL